MSCSSAVGSPVLSPGLKLVFQVLIQLPTFLAGRCRHLISGGVNCLGHSGGENLRKAIVSHLIDDIPILRHVPPILAKCSFFGHSIFSMLELGAPVHSHLLAKIAYLWLTRGDSSERGSPDHLSFKLSKIHNHQQQVSMCQKELPPFFIQNHNSFPNISSHQFNNLGAFSLQLEPSPHYGFSSDDQDHHTMVGTIIITIILINITSKLT
jgi:hypothetical protein